MAGSPRYLRDQIQRDLSRKMVFVAGPRQVGKTTLARTLPDAGRGYLNWDVPAVRAVKKEQKHYHLDWPVVPSEAARFENLVACHLLKWVHHQQDTQGRDVELRYFRDTDGREVDFVVADRRRPVLCVECKWADVPIDRSLRYFKARFPGCDAWQLSATGTKDYVNADGIRAAPAPALLSTLV